MRVSSTNFRMANLGLFTTSVIGTFFEDQALVKGIHLTDHRFSLCLNLILVEMRVLFLYSQHPIRNTSGVRALRKRSLI